MPSEVEMSDGYENGKPVARTKPITEREAEMLELLNTHLPEKNYTIRQVGSCLVIVKRKDG